ncbi:uncharacterized protein METZ01_LOCUS399752 [marine metagenome]|uniref:Uncharacterized protein n=1 Tax=marine metagenome TaxID=408172 RepID=A0A382VLW3_9ZZZZ
MSKLYDKAIMANVARTEIAGKYNTKWTPDAIKIHNKDKQDEELENRATLECIVCGSVLHGEEPRIQIVCDDCKDVRFSPLPPMSPFTNK